jgi:hypothetical protein
MIYMIKGLAMMTATATDKTLSPHYPIQAHKFAYTGFIYGS